MELLNHLNSFLEAPGAALIVVAGPTASGKTALSLLVAERFKGEIISADSAQVYRKMDIGTAKASPEERARVRHHLIDVRDPDQSFTMADFKREATQAIQEIQRRGKVPILCGGAGLYINSVVDNFDMPLAPPNPALREELERLGGETLHARLREKDPKKASEIHPNNVRYVIRALEIMEQTEKRPSKKAPLYHVFKMGIEWPREVLYERINARVDEQIQQGLLHEIKGLLEEGYEPNLQSMQALGYKEFMPYLRGEKSLEECKEELKQSTRNYAKRQLTWFRKEKDIHWITPDELNSLLHAS